jgi:Transglycosylase SLT domain
MALSPSFMQKVEEIETRLRMPQGSLLAVMRFETGGTFDPGVKNKAGSGATGLIQFMPKTAKGLGTSTEALAKMSAEDQLDYVEKYFQPYKGKMGTLKDAYLAVLYPKAIGKPEWYPLFRQDQQPTAYSQNAGLDRDKKGMVTVGDALAAVQRRGGEGPPATMTAQAPRREAPPNQPAFTAQETAPEPTAQPAGGTDWAQLLFTAEAPGTGGPGQDWARLLFQDAAPGTEGNV